MTLPWGIDVILGRNGYIWITRCIPDEWKSQDPEHDEVLISFKDIDIFHQSAPLAETLQRLKIRHATTVNHDSSFFNIFEAINID